VRGFSPRSSRKDGQSRLQGEGGQEIDRFLKPEESVDTDAKADKAWLPGVQRKLYRWSREQIEVDEAARLRYDLWRAECVTKGARSVQGGATGDRWLRDPTAFVVYSTH
jgi:hypothetical protein